MAIYQTKEISSIIFLLLLGRELSDEDYKTHFASLCLSEYIRALVDSSEFVERNILPFLDWPQSSVVCHEVLPDITTIDNCDRFLYPSILLCARNSADPSGSRPIMHYRRYLPLSPSRIINLESSDFLNETSILLLYEALQASPCTVELCKAKHNLHSFCLQGKHGFTIGLQEGSHLSVDLVLIPTSRSFRKFSFYSSVFTSLLSRSLIYEDYSLHFSSLGSLEFIKTILQSPEFLAKNIFEVLASCTFAHVISHKHVIVQLPSAFEDGLYILLFVEMEHALAIAIKVNTESHLVESEMNPVILDTSDPGYFPDAVTAAVISNNCFTHEDLYSIVSAFTISTHVSPDILMTLQSSYMLPELSGLVSPNLSYRVALITSSQLECLSLQLHSESEMHLFIAIGA